MIVLGCVVVYLVAGFVYGWIRGDGTLGLTVICMAFWPLFLLFDGIDIAYEAVWQWWARR